MEVALKATSFKHLVIHGGKINSSWEWTGIWEGEGIKEDW